MILDRVVDLCLTQVDLLGSKLTRSIHQITNCELDRPQINLGPLVDLFPQGLVASTLRAEAPLEPLSSVIFLHGYLRFLIKRSLG